MEPKQVIVMRVDTEPKMRKGKMIAQGAHASLAVLLESFFGVYEKGHRDWGETFDENLVSNTVILNKSEPIFQWINNSFIKIVLKGTLTDVVEAYEKAKRVGIPCSLIEDKGLTEFKGKITITCCAIGPDDPEKINKITGHLELL
jgi:PTH2 family peptidyl-tRNA hydrolase